ncbi:hypothetical protein BDW69DRAFT_190255 [Aspergillus filifer]
MTAILTEEPTFDDDAVAAIVKWFGPESLDHLLSIDNGSLLMDEDVWEAAASNTSYGAEVIDKLLRNMPDFPISRHVLRAAIYNDSCGTRVVDLLLLDPRGRSIPLTIDVLLAAVRWEDGEILRVLLKHRKNEIPITTTLVEQCTESSIETLLS